MKRSLSVGVLVVTLSILASVCAQAAPQILIKDVLSDPQRYVKERVSLFGVTSESRALSLEQQLGMPVKYRGEFTLTEAQTGSSILVRTIGDPPPNGKEMRVRGVVQIDPNVALGGVYVVKKGYLDNVPVPLIAAGAVLLALAVVLVVLLTRGDGRAEEPPTVDELPDFCPHCSVANPAGALFCKECGKPMVETGPREDEHAPGPGSDTGTHRYDPDDAALADLTILEGEGARRHAQFPLGRSKQRIGRKADMDIRLGGDDSISREHAAIWHDDGAFYIQDLASTSGSFVNGQRVVKQALMDNDEVRLGRTKLIFRLIGKRPESG